MTISPFNNIMFVMDEFTWEPGDLVKVGHEPLTEVEKKLVEDIKKS